MVSVYSDTAESAGWRLAKLGPQKRGPNDSLHKWRPSRWTHSLVYGPRYFGLEVLRLRQRL
jgi:hypothetical protein